MTYTAQPFSGSYSRIPDGNGDFFATTTATPSNPNNLVLSVDDPERLQVYPNPFETEFFISGDERIESVELLNTLGARMEARVSDANRIEVGNVAAGIYLLKITLNGKTHFAKLLKK